MTNRDAIIHEALVRFVDFNNAFIRDNKEDEAGLMNADDKNYFFEPQLLSDTEGPGMSDRVLTVYQRLNDELNSIGFIIVCPDDYSTIKCLVVEVDTDYKELK